jgi:hypothetical protein
MRTGPDRAIVTPRRLLRDQIESAPTSRRALCPRGSRRRALRGAGCRATAKAFAQQRFRIHVLRPRRSAGAVLELLDAIALAAAAGPPGASVVTIPAKIRSRRRAWRIERKSRRRRRTLPAANPSADVGRRDDRCGRPGPAASRFALSTPSGEKSNAVTSIRAPRATRCCGLRRRRPQSARMPGRSRDACPARNALGAVPK